MNGSRAWLEKDFYAVLGVAENATQDQVKRAHRTLARKLHPDRNPGDKQAEERMKDISEAYDVLSDPEKRREYDQVRRMARAGYGPGVSAGGPAIDLGNLGFDLGDLFGGVFGGGRRGARARRGPDLETTLRVSFEDAAHGTTVPVSIPRTVACSACHGTGDASGRPATCPECNGSGVSGDDQGPFSFVRACPRCSGSGRVVKDACRACAGSGTDSRVDSVRVKLPAGVSDGARIRMRGYGGAGPEAGDLYVRVSVDPHPLLGRRGDDLTITVPVSFAQAALGSTIRVPTLDGRVTMKVPPGTQPGTTLRARGKGIARRGRTGDLLVTVQVEVPTAITDEERALIEKLAALGDGVPEEQAGRQTVKGGTP